MPYTVEVFDSDWRSLGVHLFDSREGADLYMAVERGSNDVFHIRCKNGGRAVIWERQSNQDWKVIVGSL